MSRLRASIVLPSSEITNHYSTQSTFHKAVQLLEPAGVAGFLLESQLLKIRMLITDEGSANDRWASLAWIPGRFWMIHARDSCIQSCGVLGLLEGKGEKRKYIEDVHRTCSLLVRFRWLDCVVAEKSFERRKEISRYSCLNFPRKLQFSDLREVFPEVRFSRKNLRRFIKIILGKRKFFNLFLSFF